ncbi:MAG: hypothetical protein ACI8VC_000471 [Candidatus Endobugula sp.]|jgi:hypothetical protein
MQKHSLAKTKLTPQKKFLLNLYKRRVMYTKNVAWRLALIRLATVMVRYISYAKKTMDYLIKYKSIRQDCHMLLKNAKVIN